MGVASMWKSEAVHPGSLDSLVLFETVYGAGSQFDEMKSDLLVSVALQREIKWASRAEAVARFESFRNFAT